MRRMDYGVVIGLYENYYSQGDIAKIYDSASGHISKVLKAEGVTARPNKGKRVKPVAYSKLPSGLKTRIKKEGLVENVREVYELRKNPVLRRQSDDKGKKVEQFKDTITQDELLVSDDRDLEGVMNKAFDTIIKHSDLQKVKIELSKLDGNGEDCEMVWSSSLEATEGVFRWLDSLNVSEVRNIRDKRVVEQAKADQLLADVAMDYYYGSYSAIDPNHCKSMKGVKDVIGVVSEMLGEMYPDLRIKIEIEGLEDVLTLRMVGTDLRGSKEDVRYG